MPWTERVGRLPALWVLLIFFVVAAAVGVTLDNDARAVAAIALVALLMGYCWARPRNGVDVFLIAAAPNAVGAILEEVVGTPSWLAILFVPIALILARDADKDVPADAPA